MQVFKTYFRIIRAAKTSLIIYLSIFISISFFTSKAYTSPESRVFSETKTNIAVINRDTDTPLVKGLTDYLAKTNTLVDIPDDTEKLQDSLFFRKVEYIAIIPKGFSADFNAGGDKTIETVVVPDSISAKYVDIFVGKYLRAVRSASFSGLTEDMRIALAAKSLEAKADVQMTSKISDNQTKGYIYFFNYLAYAMLAISILGISTIMMVFNQSDLRRRNLCSPVNYRSISVQLAMGSVTFSLACWAIIMLFGVIIYNKSLLSSGLFPMLALNALVFTVVCTAIGVLVGTLIKSHNAQAAIANVVSLGMSFLCGIFVPQYLLGTNVLKIASFLPAYWYIRANDAIGSGRMHTKPDDTFLPMLIQLGFAAALFSLTLFISKQKRTVNQ